MVRNRSGVQFPPAAFDIFLNIKLIPHSISFEINDIGELQTLLEKAYLIEANFEITTEWDAYINAEEQNRDLLFTLAHDSEIHKNLLKELSTKIEGITLEKEFDKTKPEFDFSHMIDEAIFNQLIKYEKLALDLYTRIHDMTNEEFIKDHWKGDNYQEYFDKFKWLISEEEKHVRLIRELVGEVELVGD